MRTRRDSVCFNTNHDCERTLTRFVWAGDQLLWELRVPGGNDMQVGPSGLDATSASGAMYGRVSYFHTGGIDKPLLITKEGAESVVPRDTWRGQFHKGTSPVMGLVRDCQQGGQTGCLLIAWPGWRTTATHAWGDTIAPDIDVWYGGLVDGMRDASGQMYMRNRYYDPATGQFTQTDPIGLAGGLNAYGFADGDPVSYSDPYGLWANCIEGRTEHCPIKLETVTVCAGCDSEATQFWADKFVATDNLAAKAGYAVMGVLAACGESPCLHNIMSLYGAGSGNSPGLTTQRIGGGRGNNNLQPHPKADGPHSVFRPNPSGGTGHYETFRPQPNPRNPNPWQSVKRFDGTGKAHFDKTTGQSVPTPHVHNNRTGSTRPPRGNEVP
ncbi:RHS repeat-associated core domain-containing protein [Longimicrobium sp.]|uniref:RHS repeat-associated core domain-containing protein n=1 Tax=Longimicrobium sp. TaxID=2029185 RepID=UPI002E2EF365|nr:RHS repeat-associated core domain-containing protein [Longimicrobium sp.]HEX6042383.1 RHS repeat-associated core domain-containing protein [Longimicrobium sp.]